MKQIEANIEDFIKASKKGLKIVHIPDCEFKCMIVESSLNSIDQKKHISNTRFINHNYHVLKIESILIELDKVNKLITNENREQIIIMDIEGNSWSLQTAFIDNVTLTHQYDEGFKYINNSKISFDIKWRGKNTIQTSGPNPVMDILNPQWC